MIYTLVGRGHVYAEKNIISEPEILNLGQRYYGAIFAFFDKKIAHNLNTAEQILMHIYMVKCTSVRSINRIKVGVFDLDL